MWNNMECMISLKQEKKLHMCGFVHACIPLTCEHQKKAETVAASGVEVER